WKDASLEAQVLKALVSIVEDEIRTWPNGLEEDDRLLAEESVGKSDRWALAVQYRRRRKAVLLDCLSMAQKGAAGAQAKVDEKSKQDKKS
ncbi:hypothetical protein WJX84_009724, partial [Apatococcus fuscideae]